MRVLTESITKGKANVLLISTQLLAAKALDDRRRRTANCSDVVKLAAACRLSNQATYYTTRRINLNKQILINTEYCTNNLLEDDDDCYS